MAYARARAALAAFRRVWAQVSDQVDLVLKAVARSGSISAPLPRALLGADVDVRNDWLGLMKPALLLLHGFLEVADAGEVFVELVAVDLAERPFQGPGLFADGIEKTYPDSNTADLMAAVDAAVASGLSDPDNLFVTGGSGGGILTAWLVGKTNRDLVAAINALAPVAIGVAGEDGRLLEVEPVDERLLGVDLDGVCGDYTAALRDVVAERTGVSHDRLPLTVHGRGWVLGGSVAIDAYTSSRFVSALLLAAHGRRTRALNESAAEHAGLARVSPQQAEQDAQGGGLAGPVRTQEPGDRATGRTEGHVVDGQDAAEPFAQRSDLNAGHRPSIMSACS